MIHSLKNSQIKLNYSTTLKNRQKISLMDKLTFYEGFRTYLIQDILM